MQTIHKSSRCKTLGIISILRIAFLNFKVSKEHNLKIWIGINHIIPSQSSSRSHGKSFGSEVTRDFVKPEVKEASVFSRIKKPFMPSTWKWMRTSGPAKVFTYQPRLGETTTLELDVPNQFWSFVRSVRDGKKFVGKKIHMDDNSYLEMGNPSHC